MKRRISVVNTFDIRILYKRENITQFQTSFWSQRKLYSLLLSYSQIVSSFCKRSFFRTFLTSTSAQHYCHRKVLHFLGKVAWWLLKNSLIQTKNWCEPCRIKINVDGRGKGIDWFLNQLRVTFLSLFSKGSIISENCRGYSAIFHFNLTP